MDQQGSQRVLVAGHLVVIVPLGVALLAMISTRVGSPLVVSWDAAWTAAAVGALAGTLVARANALPANRGRWAERPDQAVERAA